MPPIGLVLDRHRAMSRHSRYGIEAVSSLISSGVLATTVTVEISIDVKVPGVADGAGSVTSSTAATGALFQPPMAYSFPLPPSTTPRFVRR